MSDPTKTLVPLPEHSMAEVESPSYVPGVDDSRNPFDFFKQHWLYVLVTIVASTVVANVALKNFSKETFTYQGVLLYNRSTAGSPHYVSPDLNTLSTIMKSRDVLEQLAAEFAVKTPADALANTIDVHIPFGGGSVEVKMTEDTPERARTMLERLMAMFIAKTEESRGESLASYVDDFRGGLARCQVVCEQARANMLDLYDAENIVDIEQDLLRVQEEISNTRLALDTAKMEHETLNAQLDRLTGSTSRDNNSDGSNRAAAGAMLSADMEKRAYLRDRLSEERRQARLAAELKLKESDFRRADELHKKQLISDAEFERAEYELEALRTESDGRFQKLESELKIIEGRLPMELFGRGRRGSLRASTLADTMAEIELDMVSAEGRVGHLSKYLNRKQAELARLTSFRRQAEKLSAAVESANTERSRLESLVATFEQLRRSDVGEFSVLQPASPGLQFVQSNKKKVAVGAFVLAGFVLLAPALIIDQLKHRQPKAAGTARILGIPVLAKASSRHLGRLNRVRDEDGSDEESSRLLSLRIQQSAGCDGSAVLISNIGRRGMPMSLLWEVARSAARRDNRVVLVDLTAERRRRPLFEPITADGPPPGDNGKKEEKSFALTDYLDSPGLEASEIVRPSIISKVDFVASGTGAPPIEMLGSARISHMLDELRRLYSLVIVIGPSVERQVDFELLAARTDGIVFTATKPHASELQSAEKTIRSVARMGGRVIGFVV